MARLNTTTYQRRNVERLKRFKSHFDQAPQTILEVGPGGILHSFAKLLGPSIFGRLMKGIEQPLRRLSFLKVESFEPFEIYEVFGETKPELTVVDIHDRILDSINDKNKGVADIKTQICNVAEGVFPNKQFDAIVCNSVINWESQPYKEMIHNLINSTKVGGILLLATNFGDYIDSLDSVKKLEDTMYKRVK